jgi:predicted dehydrogenase
VRRVALLGYGLAGRFFHRPLVVATPGLELTTVVTADPERRARAAADLPDARIVRRPAELWRRAEEHDLVVVATATPTHRRLAVAAVRAGLAVVVEKPVARTRREAEAVAEAARAAGVTVVPFHNRRWDAEHLTLRGLLADGALGRVLRYESRFERWRPQADPAAWRETTPSASGGGVLLDLCVHLVDQAMELFGPVTQVYAEVDARRGGADDDVFLALEHRQGVRSHLWAGALSAAPGPRLRVLGTAGAFVVEPLDPQEEQLRAGMAADDARFGEQAPERWGRLETGGLHPPRPVPSERGAWPAFYRELERHLAGRAPAPVAVEAASQVLGVLDAARASARRRRVVTL